MDIDQFVVIRRIPQRTTAGPLGRMRPAFPEAGTFAFPPITINADAFEPPAITIESASLKPAELADTARDPATVAIARQMPIALIRPFEVAGPAAAGTAWGLDAVGATQSGLTGKGVVVAVLDTGIDATHQCFPADLTLVQRDFTGTGDGDTDGHGTHCAATIFGRDVVPTRVGIARGVTKALIGKVIAGNASTQGLLKAMDWAAENGADIISMSLGFDFPGYARTLQADGMPPDLATATALEAYRSNLDAFNAVLESIRARSAFQGSTIVIAAAGNESHADIKPDYRVGASLPAAARGIVAVGAVQQEAGGHYRVADFSNTHPQIVAPGVNVLSAKAGGGLKALSGTSMACPHAAGVAALWVEAIRASGTLPTADLLMSKLLGQAKADVFIPGVSAADRGAGLIRAP